VTPPTRPQPWLDPDDPHYFSKLLMRSHPRVDSPLGDLVAGKIDEAEYRRRIDAKRAREGRPPASWDPDPMSVFPLEPIEPEPFLAQPIRYEFALFGFGVCVGIIVGMVLVWWLL